MNHKATLSSTDDKKNKILDAGIEVLREQGVSSTSMNDIIRRSGISKGGVYHYFASKNDLLLDVCQHFFEQHVSKSLQVLAEATNPEHKTAIEMIDILFQQQEMLIEEMSSEMKLFRELYIEAIHNDDLKSLFNKQYAAIFNILKNLIDEGKKQGLIKADLESEMLAASLIAIFDGFGLAHQIIANTAAYPQYSLKAARLLIEGAKT